MKNQKTEYPVMVLRENLRQQANEKTARISRSVARLTSCELLPCPEYDEEVHFQFSLAEELMYLQNCRSALENAASVASMVLTTESLVVDKPDPAADAAMAAAAATDAARPNHRTIVLRLAALSSPSATPSQTCAGTSSCAFSRMDLIKRSDSSI